jgi:hypothetical protein
MEDAMGIPLRILTNPYPIRLKPTYTHQVEDVMGIPHELPGNVGGGAKTIRLGLGVAIRFAGNHRFKVENPKAGWINNAFSGHPYS